MSSMAAPTPTMEAALQGINNRLDALEAAKEETCIQLAVLAQQITQLEDEVKAFKVSASAAPPRSSTTSPERSLTQIPSPATRKLRWSSFSRPKRVCCSERGSTIRTIIRSPTSPASSKVKPGSGTSRTPNSHMPSVQTGSSHGPSSKTNSNPPSPSTSSTKRLDVNQLERYRDILHGSPTTPGDFR